MKQIVQSYKTGVMSLEDTPVPQVTTGTVLVETVASLVSAGTEKMLVDLARKSLIFAMLLVAASVGISEIDLLPEVPAKSVIPSYPERLPWVLWLKLMVRLSDNGSSTIIAPDNTNV